MKDLKLKKQVCQDIINVANADKLELTNGLYITSLDSANTPNFSNCQVCALGALTVAYIYRDKKAGDNLDFYYRPFGGSSLITSSGKLYKMFKGLFTLEELNEIEVAYEKHDVCQHYFNKNESKYYDLEDNPQGKLAKLINYGSSFKTNKERIIAIMENIIKNGRFKV
jgi:hypothetical protein